MSTLVRLEQNVPIDQFVQNGENAMLSKISTGDARKKFANIINRVAYGKESFVLTRRGEPLAALVSMEDFMLLQEIEDRMDIEDAWKARAEAEENISWEKLRKELDL